MYRYLKHTYVQYIEIKYNCPEAEATLIGGFKPNMYNIRIHFHVYNRQNSIYL